MKKLFTLIVLIACASLHAQVGIGTTNPDGSAVLDVTATDKGMLVPRLTTAQRVAISSPATGLLVYDITTQGFWFYNGSTWSDLSTGNPAPGWALDGNAGTDPSTNFVGTTDNVPLNFRVNNTRVGHIDTSKNTFIGELSGASNDAVGGGTDNTAFGYRSLMNNTTGIFNSAFGSRSLFSNTTGDRNTAIGYSALNSNIDGRFNIAVGAYALRYNTEGSYNVGSGYGALYLNTAGRFNTATGDRALMNNTAGNSNTANGNVALFNNTIGINNTAMGQRALFNNTTGNYNTSIGVSADVTVGNLTNATAIGYNAKVDASNKVRIGNTSVTVIEGQVAWTNPSDARFKYNVKNNVPGLEFITKLKPATYYFDNKKLDKFTKTGILDESWTETEGMVLKTGFLAQEVEQAAQEVGYDFDGVNKPQNDRDKYTLAYSTFVVPLVKAVQEQQQIIDSLNEKINAMEAKLEAITQQIEASSAAPAPSVLVSN